MTRTRFRASQALVFMTLSFFSVSAFAEMGLLAIDQAPKLQNNQTSYRPLSENRLQELAVSARDYEVRAQYGLLDYNSQSLHFSDLDSQKSGLMQEMLKYQADSQFKQLKTRILEVAPNSILIKSTLFLGTAYLFCNGKTFTTHLTDDTELSGSAKLSTGTHALNVTRKNVYALGIDSGIGYEMASSSTPTLNASVSKEILPHVVASVGQRRSLASSPATLSESTGQIRFGASF